MKMLSMGLFALVLLTLSACTHVRGVVVDERTNEGLSTAILSIGRPDGIAIYWQYPVDSKGHFDFYISPVDESNLWLYDSNGDPRVTMIRIDRTQINEHMKLSLRPAAANGDMPINISQ